MPYLGVFVGRPPLHWHVLQQRHDLRLYGAKNRSCKNAVDRELHVFCL
jgi:hypothetical protein